MLRPLTMCVFFCALSAGGDAFGQGTVVASGLNNPRGLAFGPDGALYVAEAGKGSESGLVGGPCSPGPPGSTSAACFGLTGRISRIDVNTHEAQPVITGLPSFALFGFGFPPDGGAAIGPSDISFPPGHGDLFFTIGSGLFSSWRTLFFGSAAAGLGQLVQAHPDYYRYAVDISDTNPLHDSNPNAVLAVPGKELVVDSGVNALLEVRGVGAVRTLANFPSPVSINGFPVDSVPTSVVLGPDGDYYVGELTGLAPGLGEGQQVPGAAHVYRVRPEGGAPEVFRDGFTGIVDLAFLPDRSLCVLEIFNGRIVRVAPDGTRSTLASGLAFPGGMTVGPDGAVYVSNFGIFPGLGEIRRIVP
jgi:hypothetical protein